jgi:hypothetical protein
MLSMFKWYLLLSCHCESVFDEIQFMSSMNVKLFLVNISCKKKFLLWKFAREPANWLFYSNNRRNVDLIKKLLIVFVRLYYFCSYRKKLNHQTILVFWNSQEISKFNPSHWGIWNSKTMCGAFIWFAELQSEKSLIGREWETEIIWLVELTAWKNLIGLDSDNEIIWSTFNF